MVLWKKLKPYDIAETVFLSEETNDPETVANSRPFDPNVSTAISNVAERAFVPEDNVEELDDQGDDMHCGKSFKTVNPLPCEGEQQTSISPSQNTESRFNVVTEPEQGKSERQAREYSKLPSVVLSSRLSSSN